MLLQDEEIFNVFIKCLELSKYNKEDYFLRKRERERERERGRSLMDMENSVVIVGLKVGGGGRWYGGKTGNGKSTIKTIKK